MKSIPVDEDIYQYLLSKGMGTGQTASTILRRELRAIEIDDELHVILLSLASDQNETISSTLRRELHIDRDPSNPGDPPERIEFRIPAGTGTGSWNTREQMVMGIIGQTLRIINDDSVDHRLHTGSAPFPHPIGVIRPGEFADFVLQFPYDGNTQRPLYDHITGPNAQFWINVSLAP
jgi:hypothetical protein